MMLASRMLLQALADYVGDNVPDQQRHGIMLKIGTAEPRGLHRMRTVLK
jgi:hypothetical protein